MRYVLYFSLSLHIRPIFYGLDFKTPPALGVFNEYCCVIYRDLVAWSKVYNKSIVLRFEYIQVHYVYSVFLV
jgi:hypothetical protein